MKAEFSFVNLLHINISSIQKNWDQLLIYLVDQVDCLDVLILTEINVGATTCSFFTLEGFCSYSLYRVGQRSKGILTYIKTDWLSEQVQSC